MFWFNIFINTLVSLLIIALLHKLPNFATNSADKASTIKMMSISLVASRYLSIQILMDFTCRTADYNIVVLKTFEEALECAYSSYHDISFINRSNSICIRSSSLFINER